MAVQQFHFSKEYAALLKGQSLREPFKGLDLFIDSHGIIRIGGRLTNADLPYEAKHPVLLPKSDHLVNIIVKHYHLRNCHAGSNLLSSIIRQKYWIISSRNTIRILIRKCISCFRVNPKNTYPKMADLPAYRVQECTKAFTHTGVDYAGPISITLTRRRGQRCQKAYICLFSCLTTRAVHVELVSSLSSDAFIDAFKRFISRRGPVVCLYSDNGTNFVGARSQLAELYNFISSTSHQDALREEFLNNRITWKMIPPRSPHFGGCWESQIKSLKSHLYRIIGKQILTYEEMSTVLTQIEAIMNCRPLCLTSEEHNPEILTPAHFLMSAPIKYLPALDHSQDRASLLTRKQLLDSMVQSFWKKWRLEYLHSLQTRQKWCSETNPVQVGTVVLVHTDDAPPLRWPLGKIEEVFSGPDGVIRVASVRTKTGILKRPVIKLCPLPTQ
jgi:transposase InsO family protein